MNASEPYAFLTEPERFADGSVGNVATIFLTNRECPWRCVMCDLWRNTLPAPVKPGDIPRQIEYALARLAPAKQVKLYNSGSFFDRGAIPAEDYPHIAALLRGFERVIVECHPALVGDASLRFRDLLGCDLEVAMGLETAHPEVLARLNKRMTLPQYADAAATLQRYGIALRSFVLVRPPFLQEEEEALHWACRSIDFAQDCGATAVSLIPTRGGNGAMETLAQTGAFAPPTVQSFEDAFAYGLTRRRGRVFVDLWDFERTATCPACVHDRRDRLQRMNLSQ
ncbi:MAG: radical SAM protein, partial [Terriglobus roseus]|nr:radical SAM protein [Terriglobus roseus]